MTPALSVRHRAFPRTSQIPDRVPPFDGKRGGRNQPGNIMLVPDPAGPGGERIKILDFGIAKLGTHLHGSEEIKTGTGQILGTVAYMAPEQFNEKAAISGQVDVFALGCVLYRLRARRLPFLAPTNDLAIAAMHLFVEPPSLKEDDADTATWRVTPIDSMLRKQADARPTMAQVKAELQTQLSFSIHPSNTNLPVLTLGPRATGPVSVPGEQAPGERLRDSQLNVRTITQATGQTGFDKLKPERRWPVPLLMGLVAVIAFGGGAMLMRQGSNAPGGAMPGVAGKSSSEIVLPAAKEKADGAPPAAAKTEPVVPSPGTATRPVTSTPRPTESPSLADKAQAVKKTSKPRRRGDGKSQTKGQETTSIIN